MRTGGFLTLLLFSACWETALGQQPGIPGSRPPAAEQQDSGWPQSPEEVRAGEIRAFDPLDHEGNNGTTPQTPATAGLSPGDADPAVPEYAGPAVLSRNYTVNRPLTPLQVNW